MEGLARVIIERAVELGAATAGIAAVEDVEQAPSFELASRRSDLPDVAWPEGARSVIVVAVAHPADRPELDWWSRPAGPPGNRLLAGVVDALCDWIEDGFGIACTHLPYHVDKGGIYLKDAAVLAGLGRIGRNNLLVTPEHGPRVRLRALTVEVDLPSTGPTTFDPCAGCSAPCRLACPRGAFDAQPGASRRGDAAVTVPAGFSRTACYLQMDADVGAAGESGVIKYCRACELSCTAAGGPPPA
jgi:epoxyqueuosine reductase